MEEARKWHQCETCNEWSHAFCVGMEQKSEDELEDTEFLSDDCK